ncbi:MAG: FAD-dependent oxidoreductase, partial [Gemmatimonadota bacterium]
MSSDPAKLALSPALASRIHRVAPGAEGVASPDGAGEFVLYWMRTAVRAHDNPALEVALAEGRRMGLPVFVYHALSERYPYASDRHHRFILEGARDVAREMAERRIGYGFHLERPEHRGPHLVTLARRAGRVVTEDMPVAPLDRWTRKLARRSGREVWAVDSACLVPMRTVDRAATTRAFRFRKATRHAREVALRDGAPAPVDSGVGAPGAVAGVATEPGIPFVPAGLPFEPVSLPDADLAALIAACEIDHGVGPVPHTSGGSVAGYARWEAFRDQGLARYAGTRNNPLVPGVSRMSAYLHYGHVSPWRIAREAAAVGGKGGEKYLDELLVWRELAYAFCAHRPGHDTVAALPDWARQTLAVHEDDPRERLSWETLARAETGDALWDAAQRSLLVHGELHNNVRMTWGKALLGWTRDAGEALERLVDLNHRFALDGRDPASFGGILWCLGQFDRPFTPERPVLGTVRSRSTETHARRLDVDEYRRRVEQPAWPGAPRVAVVGGGLSGLMAARTLRDHGLDVTVFDKGRRPGGRASTREHGATRFDHGAQYFTIRDRRMRPLLESWLQDGVVAEWPGRLVRYRDGRVESAREGARYVGVPGMIDLASHLSRELDVRRGVRVGSVERPEGWRDEVPPSAGGGPGNGRNAASERAGRWLLRDESGGNLGRFDEVVVALPPPQAV